jgi:hypothetical protein
MPRPPVWSGWAPGVARSWHSPRCRRPRRACQAKSSYGWWCHSKPETIRPLQGSSVLEPDVQASCPAAEAVNTALRGLMALRPRPGHGSRRLPVRWDGDQANVQRVPQGRRNAVQQEQGIAVHVSLF